MKTDPIHALRLLDKILANNIEVLTQEEANFLLEHKEICSRKLLPILALEITQIKEKELWSPSKLYGSLKLLAAFKEKKAFDWVIQLHEFPEDLESEEVFFINGGMLEVQPFIITVLSDTVMRAHEIDEAAALEAKLAAEKKLSDKNAELDFGAATIELAEAVAQLRAAEQLRKRHK